ncbi:hypothetical protein [Oscillibacter sp. 1-3]|uniref:hypothetical protein n=1 Tax=Oscillibacter sp. 1-3 TaxID=1235797 RepID=UPI001FA6C9D1|nr:hypothetical protein [Oscillibacter sp. 1-3]
MKIQPIFSQKFHKQQVPLIPLPLQEMIFEKSRQKTYGFFIEITELFTKNADMIDNLRGCMVNID